MNRRGFLFGALLAPVLPLAATAAATAPVARGVRRRLPMPSEMTPAQLAELRARYLKTQIELGVHPRHWVSLADGPRAPGVNPKVGLDLIEEGVGGLHRGAFPTATGLQGLDGEAGLRQSGEGTAGLAVESAQLPEDVRDEKGERDA